MIAEGLWISSRSEVYGCTPMLVAIAVGLDPAVGMLLVPLVGVVTGFGFACFGITVAAVVSTIENFNYIVSAVLTPLFLVAGTFFPIEGGPTRCGSSCSRSSPWGCGGWRSTGCRRA